MLNEITKEDIINSVEVLWRKSQIKFLLTLWLIISCISVLPFILTVDNLDFFLTGLLVWIILIGVYGIIFGSYALYHLFKIKYILKNYTKFSVHEVCLDNFSTSYMYRRSVYYTVRINTEGTNVSVDTNPYFSNSINAKFTPNNFNNKKVIGLYDAENAKFYIVKKV